jgi:hypothetical protein
VNDDLIDITSASSSAVRPRVPRIGGEVLVQDKDFIGRRDGD